MRVIGARPMGEFRSRSGNRSGEPPKPRIRLLDHISQDTQDMIWLWYNEGIPRRQMAKTLITLGVPSPPMTVPWGDNAIRTVIEKYKNATSKTDS